MLDDDWVPAPRVAGLVTCGLAGVLLEMPTVADALLG